MLSRIKVVWQKLCKQIFCSVCVLREYPASRLMFFDLVTLIGGYVARSSNLEHERIRFSEGAPLWAVFVLSRHLTMWPVTLMDSLPYRPVLRICGLSWSRGHMMVKVLCSAPPSIELLGFHSKVLASSLICPHTLTNHVNLQNSLHCHVMEWL